MTTSELISKLHQLQDEYGDVEVHVNGWEIISVECENDIINIEG